MKLAWSLTAEAYLDQLSSIERARVLRAVAQLQSGWSRLEGSELKRLAGEHDNLFSLRAGSDIRVLVKRNADVVTVVDVVRRSQIEGLRRIASPVAFG